MTTLVSLKINFDSEKQYGEVDLPMTGNIVLDPTDAKIGTTCLIIHGSSTAAPTFGTEFELHGGGTYSLLQLNYIHCEFINPNKVIYTIL